MKLKHLKSLGQKNTTSLNIEKWINRNFETLYSDPELRKVFAKEVKFDKSKKNSIELMV